MSVGAAGSWCEPKAKKANRMGTKPESNMTRGGEERCAARPLLLAVPVIASLC